MKTKAAILTACDIWRCWGNHLERIPLWRHLLYCILVLVNLSDLIVYEVFGYQGFVRHIVLNLLVMIPVHFLMAVLFCIIRKRLSIRGQFAARLAECRTQ